MGTDVRRNRQAGVVLQKPENGFQGRLSPDGHWITYTSDASGQIAEVYVHPLPLTGAQSAGLGQWRLAADLAPGWAGTVPSLAPIGELMAASVKTSGGFSNEAPHALFDTRMRSTFIPYRSTMRRRTVSDS